MIILVDTRDQTNGVILEWFNKHKVRWKTKALKTGDYGLMIEACPELGFLTDTYFTDELCIERKNSVSELAGNRNMYLRILNRFPVKQESIALANQRLLKR